METIKYISHKLEDNIEDIKALSLYFDQIDIVEQNHIHIVAPFDAKPNAKGLIKAEVIETRDYTSDAFIAHLKEFENENVIKYSKHIVNPPKSPKGMISISDNVIINNLVITQNLIGVSKEIERQTDSEGKTSVKLEFELTKESQQVADLLFPDAKGNNKLIIYYSRLISSFLSSIEKGDNTITTSKFLNEIYYLALKNNAFGEVSKELKRELNVSPYIALEAIKLNVPNIGRHPISEILEFRLKSNDELMGFKKTLETLTLDLFDKCDETYISKNAQKLVELKVQPKLDDIKAKLKDSKFKGFQQTVSELKDPKSYSPLLLTLTDNVTNTMALMISLGFVSLNVGLEYYKNLKDVKKDGVHYLLKLNKYYG